MKKLRVEICVGTTCHIFGSSELLRLEEFIPGKYKDLVEVAASPCLKACDKGRYGGAPYVRIGERLLQRASINSILQELSKELEGVSE